MKIIIFFLFLCLCGCLPACLWMMFTQVSSNILVNDHLFWALVWIEHWRCLVCLCDRTRISEFYHLCSTPFERDNSFCFLFCWIQSFIRSFFFSSSSFYLSSEWTKSQHKNFKPLERMCAWKHTSDSLSFLAHTDTLKQHCCTHTQWHYNRVNPLVSGIEWFFVFDFFIQVHLNTTKFSIFIYFPSTVSSFNLVSFFFSFVHFFDSVQHIKWKHTHVHSHFINMH